MWESEIAVLVTDYTPPGDVTRCSIWECRDFAWNPKQSARLLKKVIKRSLASAQYVKVPIGFWEDVYKHAKVLRPELYLVEVSGEFRLYCTDFESKAAFLKRFIDVADRDKG